MCQREISLKLNVIDCVGGVLSPLLSNLVLDELDKELEKRGHRFVRYADDCNIYVHSERAGHRVMESITKFITKKLKLRVNVSKSAVGRPWKRKFLGFSFTNGFEPKRRISPEAQKKFKKRVKELTSRNRGVSTEKMVADLARYLNGWIGYFGYCQTPYVLRDMDSWIRRRLRCAIWKQWKKPGRRRTELVRRGVSQGRARNTAGTRGIWHVSRSTALNVALPNDFIRSLGLPSLKDSLFE